MPAAAPGLDQLAADPALAAGLAPAVARDLLVRLASLQALLLVAALAGDHSAEVVAPVDYLTADDVAARLQMPKGHVYELIRRGALPSIRLGKYVRVPAAPLTAEALDKLVYVAHSQGHDRRRGSADSQAPRADAAPARRARGRDSKLVGEVGAGRVRRPRVGRPAPPPPSRSTSAENAET